MVSVLQALASNTHRTKNSTTNVVIQQKSRKLLMMDILMSETCWAHKKWNKIASDIKLVFYSSTITMMYGPTNISFLSFSRNTIMLLWKVWKVAHVLYYNTKNTQEVCQQEGSIRDPKKRMEKTKSRQRRMEACSEGGQGPEGVVAT